MEPRAASNTTQSTSLNTKGPRHLHSLTQGGSPYSHDRYAPPSCLARGVVLITCRSVVQEDGKPPLEKREASNETIASLYL